MLGRRDFARRVKRRKRPKRRSKKKKRPKRPYSTGAKHKRRKASRRFLGHPVHGPRITGELQALNFWMKEMLRTQKDGEEMPHDVRLTRHPGYATASKPQQEFMRENPMPDVNMRNPPLIYI